MAEIKGIENMSVSEINRELENGAKFVVFTYVISILIMTYKKSSSIHFVKKSDVKIAKGWPYFFISLFLGWWGIPWGPLYTLQSMFYAFAGKDVTGEVLAALDLSEVAPADGMATNTGGYNVNNNGDPYAINNMVNRDNQ